MKFQRMVEKESTARRLPFWTSESYKYKYFTYFYSEQTSIFRVISIGYYSVSCMLFKSSSTVEMLPNPNFSTNTLRPFGETKAGNVGTM